MKDDDKLKEMAKEINSLHTQILESALQRQSPLPVKTPPLDKLRAARAMRKIARAAKTLTEGWEELEIACTGGCPYIFSTDGDEEMHDMLLWELVHELDDVRGPMTEADRELLQWVPAWIMEHYHARELCEEGYDDRVFLYEAPKEVLEEAKRREQEE